MSGERITGIDGDRGADISGVSGVGNTFEQGLGGGDHEVNDAGLMSLRGVVTEPKVSDDGAASSAAKASKLRPGEPVNWDTVRLEPGETVPVSEALSPREFIAALELNASLKVRVQQQFEGLSHAHEHAKDIGGNQLKIQAGKMSTALYDAQVKTIAELTQSLPQLLGAEKAAIASEYVDRLKMMVSNKRFLVYKTSGDVMRALAALGAQGAQILDDPVALNKAVAASLFEKMYGVVPEMPLMYSEGEIGIVFACDSAESVGKLYGKITKAVVSSDNGIRGFQAPSKVKDSSNDKLVIPVTGMVLASATPMDSLSLKVRKSTYRHENQHAMDYTFLSRIDSNRLKHLSERTSDPIDSTILEDLKSEIYALYDGTGQNTAELYATLTNPNGHYNYKGVLGTTVEETVRGPYDVPTEKQARIDAFKDLVREATAAIETLGQHYAKTYPGNDAWAKRMAIAMLDSYPVQDWSVLALAVERYGNNKNSKSKNGVNLN